MSDNIIELKGVNKWFGDFQVLKNVDLSVGLKQKIVVCWLSNSNVWKRLSITQSFFFYYL